MATPSAPIATPAPQPGPTPYTSGSLYVGDLLPDVTEALLFEIFNQVGPVSSIRVCRDATTRRSLGYAYVNFHNVMDAERALDTLNFQNIKGRQCRIMWSQRNPAARKSNTSNVFVKNLDPTFDNKKLNDVFSVYGNILSCKIATDEDNQSKGFGFVHFATDEDAKRAIDKLDGQMVGGKKVHVALHVKKAQRPGAAKTFTNVYVKNIPTDWSEEKFLAAFQEFGEITSPCVKKDENGQLIGYGYVNYKTHEEAAQAVDNASKIDVGDAEKPIFAARFQPLSERKAALRQIFQERRRERSEKNKNLNLYVKNLDDVVDDDKLREWFSPCGEIANTKVMRDEKTHQSRGFGFVCFTTVEGATKALEELNGKMFGSKPLYVNRAQRKEERRLLLEAQFQPNPATRAMMSPAMFYSQMPQLYLTQQPAAVMGRRFPPARPNFMYPRGRTPGRGGQGVARGRGQYRSHPSRQQPAQMVPAVPNPVMAHQTQQDLSTLSQAPPETQKQILGERLFPMVQQEQPDLAGKITGMLLEMEVADVLAVIDSPEELRSKIAEALEVLQAHEGKQSS